MDGISHRTIALIQGAFCVAIIFACIMAASAQSGRRSGGSTTTTAPSVSGPKSVEKPATKTPLLKLLVGIEDRNQALNIPYYLNDTVLNDCVRRLGDATEVIPSAAGRGMTRADALSRAKAEKEAFVVWLQIDSDVANSAKQIRNGPDELYVRYTIFEPVTAKIKQAGRAHQQIYKTGRGGVSSSSKNSPIYSEYSVKQAAREAAERVLGAFDIKLRDER